MINALLKSLSPDLTCNISNINILKKNAWPEKYTIKFSKQILKPQTYILKDLIVVL